ncbi:MAG: hypothetical protein JO264_12840 [Acidisphaera sp.]|nr:hypothetical protein [Acidisphaera sp.]
MEDQQPCGMALSGTQDDSPVLIGHSHSILIFAAARQAGFRLRGTPFAEGPQPPFDADITAFHPEVARLLNCATVFSAVGRSVHDILSLVQHPRSFDFMVPWRPELRADPSAQFIPFQVIRDLLKHHMEQDFKILALADSLAGGRLIHIISQPPLEDNELLATMPPWPMREGETFSPAPLRLKFYLVYSSLLEEWCTRRGIAVIHPPSQALTQGGFLRTSYYSNATHGNVAYGQLVLSQMQECL